MPTHIHPTEHTAAEVPGALAQLLDDVAATDLDASAWGALAHRARAVTAQLAVTGDLPAAMVIAADEPPVVIARTLQVAVRTADASRPAQVARCA